MAHTATEGVVIRVRMHGNDSYLTVLNPEKGRFTLLAKGARSMKNREGQMGISQQFVRGDFEHYKRGELEILKGGVILTSFHRLACSEKELHLAYYLCEVTEELTDVGEPAPEMYRMILNAFYDLDQRIHDPMLIKAAFEFRAATLSGYAPDLSACSRCGSPEAEEFYLDIAGGALVCPACLRRRSPTPDEYENTNSTLCRLTPAVLEALRYIMTAPLSRLFSFELKSEEDRELLGRAAQEYLLYHLGRGFFTLESFLSVVEYENAYGKGKEPLVKDRSTKDETT